MDPFVAFYMRSPSGVEVEFGQRSTSRNTTLSAPNSPDTSCWQGVGLREFRVSCRSVSDVRSCGP